MQEVAPGLFAVEEEMPCEPSDIRVILYDPPCSLGSAEKEEAAARVLSCSQKAGQWVGVTWEHLLEVMHGEFEKSQWIARAQRGAKCAKKVHKWLRVLSLGSFRGFDEDSVEKVCELAREGLPTSAIYFTLNYGFVLGGITELVQMGMLRGTGAPGSGHTFFPTPALISRIMKAQGVKVGQGTRPEPAAQ